MNPALTKYLPYILGGMGVLIAAIVASLVLLVKSSRKGPSQMLSAAMKQKGTLDKQLSQYKESAKGKAEGAAERVQRPAAAALPDPGVWTRIKRFLGISSGHLGHSFREAIRLLRQRIPGSDFRYRVPWFVMMGESGCGKTTLLDNVGLPQPFGMLGGDPFALRKALTWWMFTNGIVLDVDGHMVVSHDGKTSDDTTWHHFLTLLRRNRPERSLDGVIIAISSDDLMGPNKLGPEDLRRKADMLYEKIWSAQKATGMTFPVYVFVTKCDHISGFRSFVSELPKKLQDDMFGWSNPYSVHSAYVPEWVDEAFADLNSTIYKTQIEIFAESESVEDSDGVFLFPSEFQALADPLRIYLNHLFKESGHHESFMFRGMYFCGDAVLDAPVSTEIGGEYAPSAGAVSPKPVFLKHVFEKKIFPENTLARPVFRSVLARNRWALGGQIACILFLVFGSLALWLSRNGLQRDEAAFKPVLLDIEKDLAQIRDVQKSSDKQLTSAEMVQRLQGVDPTKVLTGMQQINTGTLKTIWLPASWPSDLDNRLHESLNITFSKIVLGSIYLNLTKRVDAANEAEPLEASADTAFHVTSATAGPEFQTLRRYVDRMKELEEFVNLYNEEAMPGSGDLPKLGKLVKYIYGTELPQSFYENSEFYLRALKESKQATINVEKIKADAADKQDELGQKFFDALSDRVIPIALLNQLRDQFRALTDAPATSASAPESYRALMATIDQLSQTFARPEFAWLGKPTFDPGPEFKDLLDSMQKSTLFGANGRMKLENMATANFDQIKSTLESYQSSLTGPVFQVADNVFKPSAPVLALRQGLEDFLNQRFMAAASGRRIRTALPQGSRFIWDLTPLQQALQLVEPYNTYMAGGLASFRPELQSRLRVLALNRLEANMVTIISGAQRVETSTTLAGSLEADVQAETKQLKEVAKPLNDILSAFDRLGMTVAYADLSDATLSTAFTHLRTVDQLFDEKSPYAFDQAGLSAWDGTDPLLRVVFGARNEKGMPQYLDAQRENLKNLVSYANPAVAIINGQRSVRRNAADTQLLAKWQGIAAEIDKYDNKNPASSVAALEAFIGTVMPSLNADNYNEKITSQDVSAQSSDFFLNRRNELRKQVFKRFDAVAVARVLRQYRELETSFNQNLAGKFPFVSGGGRGAEADPQSIREFFKLYDAYNKNIVKSLDRITAKSTAVIRALEFVDGMASVRTFFNSFLDDPKALVPIFDFEVEFRVNRRRELGGNQIIEWQFEVGDQKITARDTMRRGRWVFGDPVSLSLRWAKDATIIPVPENAELEDRTVSFRDRTRWSILRLLQTHAGEQADFDQLVDPAPSTLKFVVPTTMIGNDSAQTRVFVRLTLLTADKKEPIALPIFPVRALALDRL